MHKPIDTREPLQVAAEVQEAYLEMFPQGDREFIPKIFQWAGTWFGGKYRDYQAIDAHYHDLEHTLQGILCMARLLRARHKLGQEPKLTQRMFELGMLAILLHDTGYLKKHGDNEGTGAKYTLTHVDRSIDFAGELMLSKDYLMEDVLAVQNMIRCTGVNVKLEAGDYVDKLPVLYLEFAETASYNAGKMKAGGFFSSADDLMQKTPLFWEKYVKTKIEREFLGLYRFLNDPYPDGPNPYMRQIEANIARLRRELAARGGP